MSFVTGGLSDEETALAQTFVEWVTTATWPESRAYLEQHAEVLLTDQAEAALQRLVESNPGQQVLVLHVEILRAARGDVDAAYQVLAESVRRHAMAEGLVAWVSTQSWEEARDFFDRHAGDLLTDEAESVLAELALDNPDQPDLLVHQGLLSLCRIDAPDKAFALLSDPERLQGLVESPAGAGDPVRARPRAQLLAGLYPEAPEPRFSLALAALRAGERDEAERAIAYCAAMLEPSDRAELAARLRALADTEPDLAPGLDMLQIYLQPAGGDPPA